MTTNIKEADLKIAHTSHVAAAAALARIQAFFPLAAASVPAPDSAQVIKARLNLEDCLAARRLDEASVEDEKSARAALTAAEDAFKAAQTAFAGASLENVGLNRRLATAQQIEADAKRMRDELEVEWLLEEMRIADEVYTKQAEEIFQTYLRVTACVEALRKRNAKDQRHFALSSEMMLPTIGPVSCAAALSKDSSRDGHSFGKMLFKGSRLDSYQVKDEGVELDLVKVTTGNGASALARFAKVVTGLIPGVEK